MFSRVFIDRPIFASVLSIVLVVAGLIAAATLPVAQYPEITPPSVKVTANYPGADSNVVAETVAAPIEQQVVGVENMLYMSSQSSSDGSYQLTVTFALGTNIDIAQVLVQNRVQIAMPQLPDAVKQTGVTVKKQSPSVLLIVNLISPDRRYDQLYLSNYATIQVRDELSRLNGVGDVTMFGQRDYAMRLWLDPQKMAARNISATDIVSALREQNIQVAAGQLGQQPAEAGQAFQYTLTTLGRLNDPKQFGEIVIKQTSGGQVTYLHEIADIELGPKDMDQSCTLDLEQAVGISIYPLPGANSLQVADNIRAKMEELKARFPEGLDYKIVYDTTPFISESIHEVFKALRDAIILVAIVVLVFLQSWRSAIIPLIAVPVSIVGTFIALSAFGFSINNLTLFGLVLAIGIVVDDAIVVVEAVELNLERGLAPREAALKAMEEVGGAVVAIGFVLAAVFVPAVFITGITGQFFRQFALTIAISSLLSAFNSLTLSPALAALLLRPKHAKQDLLTRGMDLVLGWFFRLFNRTFDVTTRGYGWIVGKLLRLAVIVLVVYAGLLYVTYRGFTSVPMGFIPNQDKGYLLADIQLPDAASLERTQQVLAQAETVLHEQEGVAHTVGIAGLSFVLNVRGPNLASLFIVLDDFEHRAGHDEVYADAVLARARAALFKAIPGAQIGIFGAPPVDGLGAAGGFKVMVQDRASAGLPQLQEAATALSEEGMQLPEIAFMSNGFRANTPQLFVDVDRAKAKALGVPLSEVFNALSVYLGGYYVNDFNQFGRTWQVKAQAASPFRMQEDDVRQLQVRSNTGQMVPLGSLLQMRDASGPVCVTRYNTYPAAPVNGLPRPGTSSGRVISAIDGLATEQLPSSMGYEWTEITLLQILAGNTAIYVFAFSVLLVFLVLAAQYESWSLPAAVILVVPMCLLFAVIGVAIIGSDINIFVQIGFIVLVGLASKNAILIVEYARDLQSRDSLSVRDAAINASKLRLRPILMTSFAFILGVLPLVLAKGAGAEMRIPLGTAVFAGMLGVTLFGIFLTPVFYFCVRYFSRTPPPEPTVRKPEEVVPRIPAGH